jgi:import inner membrane translocase subunit TIM50
VKRAEAQAQYKQEQEFITQHKDELEKLRKQDEEAAMGAAPGNLWDAISQMQGGAPQPGDAQQPGQAGAPAQGQLSAPPAGPSSGKA